MEVDVLVEWNHAVQRRLAEQGDESPADWEEDEDHVDYARSAYVPVDHGECHE